MIADFPKGLSAGSVNLSTGSIIFLSLPYEPGPSSRPPRPSYPRPLSRSVGYVGAQGPRVSMHMSAMTSSPPSRSPGRIHNPETKAYPTRRSRCILFTVWHREAESQLSPIDSPVATSSRAAPCLAVRVGISVSRCSSVRSCSWSVPGPLHGIPSSCRNPLSKRLVAE